jgi:hypothetical protein
MNKLSTILCIGFALARSLPFSFSSYGKLAFDLSIFNLCDVFQEEIDRVNREVSLLSVGVLGW